MSAGGVLKDPEGRVRLVWRLLGFLGLFAGFAVVLAAVVPPGLAWGAGAQLLAALGAGWIVLSSDGWPPGALGFRVRGRALAGLPLGWALGVAVGLVSVALVGLAGGAAWFTEPGSPEGLVATGLGALWTFALPAAAEEALLRGYPLQALAEEWGSAAALWATSAAFGLLHLGNPGVSWLGVGNIVIAGLFLGAVYLRTGSLWWATGAHLGWNWLLGFGADLPVSGLDLVDTPYLATRVTGPSWLGGGAFGPEGSFLTGVVLAVAAAVVWRGRGLEPDAGAAEQPWWKRGPSPPDE